MATEEESSPNDGGANEEHDSPLQLAAGKPSMARRRSDIQKRTPMEVFRYRSADASPGGTAAAFRAPRLRLQLWQALLCIFVFTVVLISGSLTGLWYDRSVQSGKTSYRKHKLFVDKLVESWANTSFDLAKHIHQQMGLKHALVMEKMLHVPLEAVDFNARMMQSSRGMEDVMRRLWAQLDAMSEINSVGFADKQGDYAWYWIHLPTWFPANLSKEVRLLEFRIGEHRNLSEANCGELCPKEADIVPGYLQYFAVNATTGQPLAEIPPPEGRKRYEPSKQHWYVRAESARGEAAWTNVGEGCGIEAVQGHFVGEQMSSMTFVDVNLQALSQELRANTPDRRNLVFVMDFDGIMIASSKEAKDEEPQDSCAAPPHHWRQSNHSLVVNSVQNLVDRFGGSLRNVDASGEAAYFGAECQCIYSVKVVHSGRRFGMDWLIITAEKASIYIEGINKTRGQQELDAMEEERYANSKLAAWTKLMAWLSAFLVLLGALSVGVVARNVTQPLRSLKESMQAVAKLELESVDTAPDPELGVGSLNGGPNGKPRSWRGRDKSRRPSTSIREIAEIQDSFQYMASGLQSFSRYMDPYVVQLLVKSKLPAKLGVAQAEVTVFFSDIAGFSTIAESLGQQQFMSMFGKYLDEMSDIIMGHEGVVGEFVGDAIMAWWNAPLEIGPGHTQAALAAALEQQARLSELRQGWAAEGLPDIHARMGLVKGTVLAGNVGSTKRMKYGLVGDSVNLASRLESLCKHFGVSILIDGEACAAPGVQETFLVRPVALVTVKGRHSATELFELVGFKGEAENPALNAFCEDFALAQEMYRAGNFAGALEAIRVYRESWPEDVPAKMLEERCTNCIANPPDGEWSPIETLMFK